MLHNVDQEMENITPGGDDRYHHKPHTTYLEIYF